MKRMIALLLAMLLLVGCSANTEPEQSTEAAEESTAETTTEAPEESTEETAEVPEEEAPSKSSFGSFTAQTLTGETVTEAIFAQADLTVVNLWGTFCGPCINEMPTLGMLHEELENVQVLGIVLDCTNRDGSADSGQVDVALDIATTTGAIYPTAILNTELIELGMANYQYVPTTLFVDSEGNIIGSEQVGAMDEAGWRATIAERLEMIGK